MLRLVRGLIWREWKIVRHYPWPALKSLIFLGTCTLLFPLCLGTDPGLLARTGSALLWIVLVFLNFIAADNLFDEEHHHGVTDQWIVMGLPLEIFWLCKALRHWITSGALLLITLPLTMAWLHIPEDQLVPLATGLLLGSLNLSLISTMGAVLTLGSQRLSLQILMVPLMVPSLILGAGSAVAGNPWFAMQWLVALACGSLPLFAFLGAKALHFHAEHR